MADPAERERDVARLLDRWPWQYGGVIIGGYAVAAYGFPRYSTDVDLVVKPESLKPLGEWLAAAEFRPGPIPENIEQNYAGRGLRYKNGDTTIDLLPGVVRDREASVDVPESWISKDPIHQRLVLLDGRTETAVPVCRVTAFWALKLQAGREKDLSDMFVTRDERIDTADIQRMYRGLRVATLDAKLQTVVKRLDDPKIQADVRSRLGMGRRSGLDFPTEWTRFKTRVVQLVDGILE